MENNNIQTERKQRRIYSTAIIEQMINDAAQGYEIDYSPFFQRDLDLRAANIPFKLTDEEMEEYQKCFDNPIYYAESYAHFMTDKGLSTVDLRDYQKNVITTVTEEVYDEENDLLLPVNRNIVWMSARQSGKCVTPCTTINYKNSDSPICKTNSIFNLEYKYKNNNILSRIKRILYKIYNKI